MINGVGITAPELLVAAFNPVTLNLSMIALSAVAYLAGVDLPSAASCLREQPEKKE
ncbi:MAG: DoxX-like family protein [Acidobacteriales bacterium]|nr:DoxX-like family protein [Terriglobales bacterium]